MQNDPPRKLYPSRAVYSLMLGIIPAALLSTSAICHAQNPIQLENAKPGTADWQLTYPATDHEIEGYASATTVKQEAKSAFS